MLDELDFGRDDAESEDKEFFQKVFIPTKVFDRVRNNKKWLVLGRKGSGKTAICLTLLRQLQSEQADVSLITPANLSVATNSMLSKGSIDISEASMLSWKYIFLIELSKYVYEATIQKFGKNYLSWSNEAQQVRSFLSSKDNNFASGLDKAIKVISSINKFALTVAAVEASAERSNELQAASDIRDSLDDIAQVITKCLDNYYNRPIHILVDKVDELWDEKQVSSELIVGLLQAAKEIRSQIQQARVVVFLRSDIFQTLRFQDSDKYHSIEESVGWDEQGLLNLISFRIRASVGGKSSAIKTWQKVFSDSINREDSFQFLLNHTLMKPRDLIQLCNECRDVAQNAGLTKIDSDSVLKALPIYSQWKLKDVRAEYNVQYPFLERVLEGGGIFYGSPHRFDRKILEELIEPRMPRWSREFGEQHFRPINQLLKVFYQIGFVGVVKPGKVLYFYDGVPITVADVNEFVVHPVFRPGLNIKETIDHMRTIRVSGNVYGGISDDYDYDDDDAPSSS